MKTHEDVCLENLELSIAVYHHTMVYPQLYSVCKGAYIIIKVYEERRRSTITQ
jgi:hypothetical protein